MPDDVANPHHEQGCTALRAISFFNILVRGILADFSLPGERLDNIRTLSTVTLITYSRRTICHVQISSGSQDKVEAAR